MTRVLRCNICNKVSDEYWPRGWKTVHNLFSGSADGQHVCEACFAELEAHGRRVRESVR